MTSPEPSMQSSLPSSSDGAADVGLATALGTTACDRDRVAVGFAVALRTTACTGDGGISVDAALETIAHNGNNRNKGDDGDNGEGAAVSVAAASSRATPGLMGSSPSNGAAQTRDHWQKRANARIMRRTGITRRRQKAGASWLIGFAALARGSTTIGKISAISMVLRTMAVDKSMASSLCKIRGPPAPSIAQCAVIENAMMMSQRIS